MEKECSMEEDKAIALVDKETCDTIYLSSLIAIPYIPSEDSYFLIASSSFYNILQELDQKLKFI